MAARLTSLLLALVLVAACSTGEVREQIEAKSEMARQAVEHARQPAPVISHDPLVVTDAVWAGKSSVRMRRGQPLPSRYEQRKAITLVSAEPMSLQEILQTLATRTGVSMQAQGLSATGSADAGSVVEGMALSYEGGLSGLLEQVANHFGLNWWYDGSSVVFSRYETRVFTVEALPGTATYSDEMKGDDGSGGGGGSSGSSSTSALKQEARMKGDLDVWGEIGQTVNALLGGVGTAVIAPSTGTVTVTTTSDVMKSVAGYIEEENRRLSRQIAVNVEVYTVDLNNSDDLTVNLQTVLKRLAPFSFDVTGASPFTISNAGQFAISIIDNGSFGQADLLFNALSEVGNTVRVAQFPMTTLNNRPVSRRIGRDRAYLAEVATSTSQSFQSTTLTAGTIREGFSMQLTPRMLTDGRILMQYSLNLTDLITLREFQSGTNAIQLPETSSRVFVQQSVLKSGSTLVLAGFDQDQTTQNSRGIGNAYNYLLGGGVTNGSVRQMLFIAITPQELGQPRTEKM